MILIRPGATTKGTPRDSASFPHSFKTPVNCRRFLTLGDEVICVDWVDLKFG